MFAGVRKTAGVISCHTPTSPGELTVGQPATLVAAGGRTTSVIVVVADKPPEVPVTVTVDVERAAELLAVNVRALVEAVELGLNEAVTPAGRFPTLRSTLPAKPFKSLTVTVVASEVP